MAVDGDFSEDGGPEEEGATYGGGGHAGAAAGGAAHHRGPAGGAGARPPVRAGAGAAAEEEDEDDEVVPAAPAGGVNPAFLSTVRYTDPEVTSRLSANTLRALNEKFRFTFLSKVQAATLPIVLEGKDVFAKAKTGSGKTLGFLVPIVELLRRENAANAAARRPAAAGVRSLVVAPTRELALQILAEAHTLLAFDPGFKAESVIGGRNINSEKSRMGFRGGGAMPCVDILVATPGRLIDHMENTPGFVAALGRCNILVLDEADRMLDMGFRPSLERIAAVLPPNGSSPAAGAGARFGAAGALAPVGGRQTLLFSATVPREVLTIATFVLKHGYRFEDCVGADEPETNVQVYQEYLVTPSLSVLPALARILAFSARADSTHKILVFFPTARVTGYFATLFGARSEGGMGFNIVEIHSRKSQSARNAAAERFKREKGIIMFSSDVAARGMDFPDVTRVIQVGLTDREQYVHRLGRTARAGKSGAGLLLLADFEAGLLGELKDIPLVPAGAASTLTGGSAAGLPGHAAAGGAGRVVPVTGDVAPSAELASVLASIPGRADLSREASQAYGAFLGFYNGQLRRVRWTKETLVAETNRLFLTLGLREVPMMPRDTLGKMGLRGVAGLREGPKGWKPGKD